MGSRLRSTLSKNLLWALKHNNPEFVELYLDYGARCSEVGDHGVFFLSVSSLSSFLFFFSPDLLSPF